MADNSEINYQFFQLIASPIVLLLSVLLHITIYRISNKLTVVMAELYSFIICLLILIIIEFFYYTYFAISLNEINPVIDILLNILIFSCLSFIYFALINIGETSLRIQILQIIKGSPNGVELEKITILYNNKSLVNIRLDRMIHNQQVIQKEEKYILGKSRLIYIAHFCELLKKLFLKKGTL
jgi:hypothetical protein